MLHAFPREIVQHIIYQCIPDREQRQSTLRALRLSCKYYRYWIDTNCLLKMILSVEVDRSKLFLHNSNSSASNNGKNNDKSGQPKNNYNLNNHHSGNSHNNNKNQNNNNTTQNQLSNTVELQQYHSSCISLGDFEAFLRGSSTSTSPSNSSSSSFLPIYILWELRIEGGSHLTAEDFSSLACIFHLLKQKCHTLHQLVLYSFNNIHVECPDVSNEALAQQFNYDNYYTSQFYSSAEEAWTTDDIIKYLPPSVQSLCLYNCLDITDFGLNELRHAVPQLRSLDVRYCSQRLTDDGLKGLPSQLEEITLFNYSNLTDKGLKNMQLWKIPEGGRVHLQHLRLSRTQVTEQGVKRYLPHSVNVRLWKGSSTSPSASTAHDSQQQLQQNTPQQQLQQQHSIQYKEHRAFDSHRRHSFTAVAVSS